MREVQRKLDTMAAAPDQPASSTADGAALAPARTVLSALQTWMERTERIRTKQRKDKNKLYAPHAPEVECIGKGKARKPYEFGVKVSLAVTHLRGPMVEAKSYTGNPFDGHTLAAQLEQATNLQQDLRLAPKQAIVDLD